MVILFCNLPRVVVEKVCLRRDSSLSHTPLICAGSELPYTSNLESLKKDIKERKKVLFRQKQNRSVH